MDRVYGSAVDDTAAYLASDGRVDHALAASILKMLKKQAVDEMVRQTEIRFTEGSGKEPSGKAGKSCLPPWAPLPFPSLIFWT